MSFHNDGFVAEGVFLLVDVICREDRSVQVLMSDGFDNTISFFFGKDATK